VLILTVATLLLMWLGEQITERGIGNGVSLIITIGILARLPQAGRGLADMLRSGNLTVFHAIALVLLLAFVVAGVIAVTQAQRKIPVQYTQRVVGRKVYGGSTSFLPLRLNFSGGNADHFCRRNTDGAPAGIYADGGAFTVVEVAGEAGAGIERGHRGLYHGVWIVDPFLFVFLDGDAIQRVTDSGRFEEERRVYSGRAPRAGHEQLFAQFDEPDYTGRRGFFDGDRGDPDHSYAADADSVSGGAVFRRHEHVDQRGGAAGHDAADGVAFVDEALRRFFAGRTRGTGRRAAAARAALRIRRRQPKCFLLRQRQNDRFENDRDLEAMRPACSVAGSVLNDVAAWIKPGVTTKEIDLYAAARIKHYGGKSAFLGYRKYPCQICISVNEQVVHGLAGERRVEFGGHIEPGRGCGL